jgi:hypothetical protein
MLWRLSAGANQDAETLVYASLPVHRFRTLPALGKSKTFGKSKTLGFT